MTSLQERKKADVNSCVHPNYNLKGDHSQTLMGGGEDKKSPYVVQEVSNFENQLTKDWQAMTGQKI